MKKALLALSALALVLSGCANLPASADRINLITLGEAQANHCEKLGWVGSVAIVPINGKARNTAQIVKKALKIPGATHIAYTKGEAGYSNARAQVLKCPNPNLKTKDPDTRRYSKDYLGHD
ncbi:hypothetical protein [Sutterella sp.]|uniref:hypothetical protein n=1 Tax=Sutterella sp. TaxID=1981025 RepID=UPI003FD8C097